MIRDLIKFRGRYRDAVMASRPFGLWMLDEPSGTSARNARPGGAAGTYYGASLNVPGPAGFGASFGGSGYVDLTTLAGFGATRANGSGIEFWLRTAQTAIGAVVGVANSGSGTNAFIVRVNANSSGAGAAGCLYFAAYDSVVRFRAGLNTSAALNDGRWHHVAASYSPGSGLTVFVDGVSRPVSVYYDGGADNFAFVDFTNTATAMAFNNGTIQQYVTGSLSGLALFPRPIAGKEVLDHYRAGTDVRSSKTYFVPGGTPARFRILQGASL